MRHASPGDNGANYYAEDVEVDAPSFDGRSSSGSRSYRTSEIGATFEDHVCTPSPYGPSPYKFGTAEWFRSKEDLFRQTGGKHGIPKGLPGISAADPGGRIKFARNPNYPGVKYGVPDGLPGMSSADPGGRLTSARRPNYLDSGARAWEAWKED